MLESNSVSTLSNVQRLYHDNQYLKAWAQAQQLGPVREWRDRDTLLIGGRLVRNIGARRLGRILHAKAWRLYPKDPEAIYFKAWVWHDFGPWQAWRFMKSYGELSDAPKDLQADWFALYAQINADFRDFDAADVWIDRALKLYPERAWIHVCLAHIRHAEDRYEDSLTAARESLRLRPHYRPALQHCAYMLSLAGRDEEAIAMLTEGAKYIESGDVWAQLGSIHSELGNYAESLACYKRYAEYSPLLDKYGLNAVYATLANEHYLNCDTDEALELAKKVEHSSFYTTMVERLEKMRADPDVGKGLKRVQLPVEFIRQHHMTCAPATLSALSKFWSRPVDHLELAQEICYDGTPHHTERTWAIKNGWIAFEFSVDLPTTMKLIDRGIPFTVTTVETTSAHLQAIIGYDSIRGTLLIRDPYDRHLVEVSSDAFLERYKSNGPRGMVMVPGDRAELLNGIELPDAELFTHLYEVYEALNRHDRTAAQEHCEKLEHVAPGHVQALRGKRVLCNYDGDQVGALATTEKLLERFPRDAGLVMNKLALLQQFNRRDERIALLNEICSLTPGKDKEEKEKGIHDPVFWEMLARETRADARERDHTLWLIRNFIRWRPSNSNGYNLLAGEYWDLGRFEEATDLYRFAACLGGKEEYHQQTYFTALRNFKREETALQLMRDRVERWGAQNSQPAQTLHWALNQLDRNEEADAVLEKALKTHPDDGELLLYTTRNYAVTLKGTRAKELLSKAENCSSRGAWLRAAAFLARLDGELIRSAGFWREILEREPLAIDAHRSLVRIVGELEGVNQAVKVLRDAAAKYPSNYPLHQLLTEWLRHDPAAQEEALRNLLQIHPADGWAHREHALVLSSLRRFEDAEAAARRALQLEPRASASHCILAEVLSAKGDLEQARAAYRAALEIAVDYDTAIYGLSSASISPEEKRAALKFIHEQIVRQTIFGDSLISYHYLANRAMDAEAVLVNLREAHKARPDLWQAWAVLVRQLTEMSRLDEAEDIGRQATARFPLLGRLWIDLSEVLRFKRDRIGREEALRRALAINPSWSYALRMLSQVFEDELNYVESRKLLETACSRDPLDATNKMYLATILWKQNERDAAILKAQEALKIDSSLQWAWDVLRTWSDHSGRSTLVVDLARNLTETRPGEARNWLMLARVLPDQRETVDERVGAIDRALALEPRNTEAFDLKAIVLTNGARFEEAKQACNAPVWNGHAPIGLQARSAWVEMERGNKTQAIELMRVVLNQESHFIWGWQRLTDWCSQVGDMKGALQASESIVRLLPSEATSYGFRAIARLEMDDRAGAYQDLERALQIQPDYLWAGRKLVDLYLEDAKWDEAERVVTALRIQSPTDPFTIARQAQLDARRRRVDRLIKHVEDLLAIQAAEDWPLESTIDLASQFGQRETMKRLLDEATQKYPDYYAGWQQTANFHNNDPKCDAYLNAARNMVRIRPQSYLAYGYLGFAYKERGEMTEAMQAFEQGLKLDPRYDYAAHHLFDHYEKSSTEKAEQVLRIMLEYSQVPSTFARAVRFYCSQKNKTQALVNFDLLLKCHESSEGSIKQSMDLLSTAGWSQEAVQALKAALNAEAPNGDCGVAWVQWMADKDNFRPLEESMASWDWKKTHAQQGVREYVLTLYRLKRFGQLRSFSKKYRERLRAHDLLWGTVGYAFMGDDSAEALRWMEDWSQRPAAEGWILLNVVQCARELGRTAVAHGASLQAVASLLDSFTADHEVWLAWDDATDGSVDSAKKRLGGTDFNKLRPFYKMVHLLAQAMCEVSKLRDEASQREAWKTLQSCVRDAEAAGASDWSTVIARRIVVTLYYQALRARPGVVTGWYALSAWYSRVAGIVNGWVN